MEHEGLLPRVANCANSPDGVWRIWPGVNSPDTVCGIFARADARIRDSAILNCAREHWMKLGENPPVGLILCAAKGAAEAHYALEGLSNKVLAAEYQTVLPDEKVLAQELARSRKELEGLRGGGWRGRRRRTRHETLAKGQTRRNRIDRSTSGGGRDREVSELGIRLFVKGTLHKPPLSGAEVGSKRLFSIEPGDLMFSNVFAREGAVAVAKPASQCPHWPNSKPSLQALMRWQERRIRSANTSMPSRPKPPRCCVPTSSILLARRWPHGRCRNWSRCGNPMSA